MSTEKVAQNVPKAADCRNGVEATASLTRSVVRRRCAYYWNSVKNRTFFTVLRWKLNFFKKNTIIFYKPPFLSVLLICTYVQKIMKNHLISRALNAGVPIKPCGLDTGQNFKKYTHTGSRKYMALWLKKKKIRSENWYGAGNFKMVSRGIPV